MTDELNAALLADDCVRLPTPRISVITASTRPEGLVMVGNCLAQQTFTDFEWLACLPGDKLGRLKIPAVRFFEDPPRRPGDFYRLNGSWNKMALAARAPLLVFAVDWIWFGPDALESFAIAFEELPAACVTSIGHHYRKVVDGRPERRHTDDRRQDAAEELGYAGGRCPAEYFEASFASVPREKLLAAGGFDEAYDAVRGMSEKEAAARLEAHGCTFHLGTAPEAEHRIWTHPHETPEAAWQPLYQEARRMYDGHVAEIKAGTRRTIPFNPEPAPR